MVVADQKRRPWTEVETILGLYLYFQLPFGKLHSRNPEIQQLAAAINRTNDSVAMKLCNFASLDPAITGSGRKGLVGASSLDRAVYAKFGHDWTGLLAEAGSLWEQVVAQSTNAPKINESSRFNETRSEFKFEPYAGETVTEAIVSQRLGQGFFRRAVLANFEESCCITGIADPRLLVASHIKPWGVDVENRHNPANGFLLSATMDRAFDRGLITVKRDGRVRVSKQLSQSTSAETRTYFAPFDERPIRSPVRFDPDPAFLDWHFQEMFLDSGD